MAQPDIAGPGAQILGAVPPSDLKKNTEFDFHSGTSMATPHIAGIVALLKSLHPHWSPAAIKSAIVTTGICPFHCTAMSFTNTPHPLSLGA